MIGEKNRKTIEILQNDTHLSVETICFLLYKNLDRGVAQPGSASALGAECRGFESSRPDQNETMKQSRAKV